MRDNQLTNPAIWPMVLQENRRQLQKWGIQDCTPFEWLCFITEEIGELAEAISERYYRGGKLEDVTKEAIQAATLCLKVAEMHLNEQMREFEEAEQTRLCTCRYSTTAPCPVHGKILA